jgi:methanogenic corrinoid protein MtbC1
MPPTLPDLSVLRTRYLAAQLAGDRQEALRLVMKEGISAGIAVPDLVLQVIQPAQYEIGRLWQENRISVAQEHLGTAISQLVLAHLYPHLPRERRRGRTALVATVEGELHDMGARVTADFLEMAGYDVRYLGASVPADHLVAMIEQERPHLLALSTTIPTHLPMVRRTVDRVCEATKGELPILLGGRAFTQVSTADWQASNVSTCATVGEMIDVAERMMKPSGAPGDGSSPHRRAAGSSA